MYTRMENPWRTKEGAADRAHCQKRGWGGGWEVKQPQRAAHGVEGGWGVKQPRRTAPRVENGCDGVVEGGRKRGRRKSGT